MAAPQCMESLSAKEAKEFISVIDRLEEWVNIKALFDTAEQKKKIWMSYSRDELFMSP